MATNKFYIIKTISGKFKYYVSDYERDEKGKFILKWTGIKDNAMQLSQGRSSEIFMQYYNTNQKEKYERTIAES